MINGVAISLCLNRGATSGGTDFISIYLSEKSNMDTFNVILGFNAVILCVAGFMFGWDKSTVFYHLSICFNNRFAYALQKFQQSTLLIVTNKPKEIADAIYAVSQHGATILDGEGSYEHCERQIVYSVVSAAQTKKGHTRCKRSRSESLHKRSKNTKTLRKILSSKRELI